MLLVLGFFMGVLINILGVSIKNKKRYRRPLKRSGVIVNPKFGLIEDEEDL